MVFLFQTFCFKQGQRESNRSIYQLEGHWIKPHAEVSLRKILNLEVPPIDAFTHYFIILFVSFFCHLASVRFLSGLHLCCLFWIQLSFLPSPSAHCSLTFSCVVLFYHLFLALLHLTEVMLSFCLSSVCSCLVLLFSGLINTTYIVMFLVVFARKVLNEFWRCRASSCLQSINLWRSSSSNLINLINLIKLRDSS